jgi:hypothetical protein
MSLRAKLLQWLVVTLMAVNVAAAAAAYWLVAAGVIDAQHTAAITASDGQADVGVRITPGSGA